MKWRISMRWNCAVCGDIADAIVSVKLNHLHECFYCERCFSERMKTLVPAQLVKDKVEDFE